MRVETSAVAHAPVDEVWRWWTDYGRPGERMKMGHGFGRSERRVLLDEGDRVVLEDRVPLLRVRHEVKLYPTERRLEEASDGPVPFETRWTFEDVPGGSTRITRVVEVRSKAADALAPLAAPIVRDLARRDLLHHVKEFEGERPKEL